MAALRPSAEDDPFLARLVMPGEFERGLEVAGEEDIEQWQRQMDAEFEAEKARLLAERGGVSAGAAGALTADTEPGPSSGGPRA